MDVLFSAFLIIMVNLYIITFEMEEMLCYNEQKRVGVSLIYGKGDQI